VLRLFIVYFMRRNSTPKCSARGDQSLRGRVSVCRGRRAGTLSVDCAHTLAVWRLWSTVLCGPTSVGVARATPYASGKFSAQSFRTAVCGAAVPRPVDRGRPRAPVKYDYRVPWGSIERLHRLC
jgi:hypothetical protein